MGKEESKETVRSFIRLLNSRELSRLGEVCNDSMVYRLNNQMGAPDLESYKSLIQGSQDAFPDLEFVIEELLAEDNKVHMIYRLTGTHEGDYMGIKASQNKVDVVVSAVVTIENGKLAEQKEFHGTFSFMKQVDAVPG